MCHTEGIAIAKEENSGDGIVPWVNVLEATSSTVSNPANAQTLQRIVALTSLQEFSLDTPLLCFPSVLL
jgi:hypothetical protein